MISYSSRVVLRVWIKSRVTLLEISLPIRQVLTRRIRMWVIYGPMNGFSISANVGTQANRQDHKSTGT